MTRHNGKPRNWKIVVYYESIKRELKTEPIYECRCEERLKSRVEESRNLHASHALSWSGNWNTVCCQNFFSLKKWFYYCAHTVQSFVNLVQWVVGCAGDWNILFLLLIKEEHSRYVQTSSRVKERCKQGLVILFVPSNVLRLQIQNGATLGISQTSVAIGIWKDIF